MASPFKQIWNALGRILDGSEEDPKAQLADLVEELDDQIVELRKAVAVPMTHEKRLRMQIEERLAKAGEREQRAILALREGDEELAKQALLKKTELEERTRELHQEWEQQRAAAVKLQESLRRTKQRVDDAKRQSAIMVARHRSMVAQKKVADITVDSTDQAMARLNEKILELEAETGANLELSGESLGDDLEMKFRDLERKQKGEQALAQLKASLREPKKLAAGSPVAELKAKLDGS